MILRRNLEIDLPEKEINKLLSMQIRDLLPFGYVNESKFRLYKTALSSGHRIRSLYILTGTVNKCSDHTVVRYTLRPPIPKIVMLCIMFYTLVDGVVRWINGANNEMFLLIGLVVNILVILIVIGEEQQCIERFEKYFISTEDSSVC